MDSPYQHHITYSELDNSSQQQFYSSPISSPLMLPSLAQLYPNNDYTSSPNQGAINYSQITPIDYNSYQNETLNSYRSDQGQNYSQVPFNGSTNQFDQVQ